MEDVFIVAKNWKHLWCSSVAVMSKPGLSTPHLKDTQDGPQEPPKRLSSNSCVLNHFIYKYADREAQLQYSSVQTWPFTKGMNVVPLMVLDTGALPQVNTCIHKLWV